MRKTVDGGVAGLVALAVLAGMSQRVAAEQNSNPDPTDRTKVRWSLYSQTREAHAGDKLAKQIEKPGSLLPDHVVVDYVNGVAKKVLAASGSDRAVTVQVLTLPAFNAFSIPGGTIYVTVGLLKGLDSESELASVLGHEVGHVTARHWANQQSKRTLLRTSSFAISAFVPFGSVGDIGYNKAQPHLLDAFSRQEEYEADSLGLKYISKAGYDPSAFISFLRKAAKIEENDPEKRQKKTKDHPQTEIRIAKAEQQIAALLLQRGQTTEAGKEFMAMQGRLPGLIFEKPTTRITITSYRNTPPSIVNPTEITDFMPDETPPVLKWKDPSQADDDGN